MRRAAPIAALVLAICPLACAHHPASPQGAPDGVYAGEVTYRGAKLAFSLRFGRGKPLRAFFDSPDLMSLGEPLEEVAFARPRLRFTTRGDHPVRFDGEVDGDSITGSATVGDVPGVIARGDTARMRFVLRRTTLPEPPYAYHDVTFKNGDVVLGGMVYLPPGGQHALPGVVILQGSTANVRYDYRFYADHFARAGFAVMVFDKRGSGVSGGDYGTATYDDLAGDAAAALATLRAEPQVARGRVGLWGLSQGALLAPMVAARSESLAFVVAVSAPGVSTGECAAYQDSVRLRSAGFASAEAESAAALDRRLIEWIRTGHGRDALEDDLERLADRRWRRASSIPRRLPGAPAVDGWYWRGRTFDPLPSWRALRAPALVVFGAADELLPAPACAANIEGALREGGSTAHAVKVFPSANHMMLTLPLVAGGPWDWPRAAPGYLQVVDDWMRAHARPGP